MNDVPDPTALTAVLDFGGALATALLVYLGARFTARQSTKSSGRQVQVSERQVDVEEWRGLVSDLKGEVERLTRRVDALETRRDSDARKIDSLESDVRSGIDRYRVLLTYLRDVLAWAVHAAPGHAPPPAPASVASELNPERTLP